MTTKAKIENYSPALVAVLLATYDPKADEATRTAQVAQLAAENGKTTRSVIAKLSNLKVYVPKVYATKKGTKPVSKAAIVGAIAGVTGASEDVLDSLSKATKNALVIVYNAITEAQDAAGDFDPETD